MKRLPDAATVSEIAMNAPKTAPTLRAAMMEQVKYRTIVDCVSRHAGEVPQRLAIVAETGSITYGQLAPVVDRLARRLLKMGIKKGDIVGVLSYPRIDAYELHLALISIGAIWLGINPKYKYPEMEYITADARPVALFFVSEQGGRQYEDDIFKLKSVVDSVKRLVCFDKSIPGTSLFRDVLADDDVPADIIMPPTHEEDVAMIVYTSGSSGKPKGCMLRNKSMVHRGQIQIRDFDFTGEYPILYNPWPMNHVGGIQLLSAYSCVAGGTLVFQQSFEAENICRLVRENKINILILLPTMFHLLFSAKSFNPDDLASVELFMFVGASLSPDQIRKLQRIGQGKVQTNYGLTEGHSTVTISTPGLDPEILSVTLGQSKSGEVRVLTEDGKACGVGMQGELQIRPEYCMRGYLNRPEATAAAFTEDGWLKTGDRVEVLQGGEMRLIGRMSEMYKSGGYNIYPREVEMCLEEHPSVGLAAVVKRADELYGEVGCAYIVPKSGKELSTKELKAWCKERIADYKVPKDFIITASVPLLPNNKIDKVTLQKQVSEQRQTV
jgi:acyl-CoA synthetase (AMP-forming)/AMP-acid ligase II